MKPEQRPAEAERIGGEVSEIVEALREKGAQVHPETDLKKGIAQHPWILLGVSGSLVMACGVLLGRATDSEGRERASILKALYEQRSFNEWISGRVGALETGQARYGDDMGRVLKIIEDSRKDELTDLRAKAEARGDDRAVAKYDKKLTALANGNAGGQ